jgi:alpha-L-rhamnosidase
MISSHWKTDSSRIQLDVEIPVNTTARIYVPAPGADTVTENNIPVSSSKEIKVLGKEGDYLVVEAGSGKYRFSSMR